MPRDNRPPAFMFYPDDFSSDDKVEAMSTEAVGCYVLLICKAWRSNPPATLPDNDGLLARWSRVSETRWNDLKSQVLSAWTLTPGNRWLQRRLKKEYDKQCERRAERSTSGKKGAEKRWQAYGTAIGSANGAAIANERESETENEPCDSSLDSELETTESTARTKRFVKPTVDEVAAYCRERNNGVDPEAFVAHYESNGWRVGKVPMTSWKHSVITWEKNEKKRVFNGNAKPPRVGPGQHYDPNDTAPRVF